MKPFLRFSAKRFFRRALSPTSSSEIRPRPAKAEGRPEDAIVRYRAALPGLAASDTHLFEHAVKDRLGRLIGGDEGAALQADVRRWLASESVREPETMLGMLLPGPLRMGV